MRHLLSFALVLGVAAGALAQQAAPVVVVARVADAAGPWPACGHDVGLGEVVVDVVRVERGTRTPRRFVAVFRCPGPTRVQGTLRLHLSHHAIRGSVLPPRAPAGLPRLYVEAAELAEAPPGLAAYLGGPIGALARAFVGIGGAEGWSADGHALAVKVAGGRIAELRARLPRTMTCSEAARWMGFAHAGPPLRHRTSCEWPGISERHRLAPGVVGRLSGGVFEVRRSDGSAGRPGVGGP